MSFALAKHLHLSVFNFLPVPRLRDQICVKITRFFSLSPLSIRMPWMCYDAISFLHSYLRPGMSVFEYGSGGSTLFFLDHGCNVVSIEHDSTWYQEVIKAVEKSTYQAKLKIDICEPKPVPVETSFDSYSSEESCLSIDSGFDGFSFEKYVKSIEDYDDFSFDLVLIDGRARRSCLHYASSKVKIGGLLVLDNSEREYYLSGHIRGLLSFQVLKRFSGLPPTLNSPTSCTIFQRTKSL